MGQSVYRSVTGYGPRKPRSQGLLPPSGAVLSLVDVELDTSAHVACVRHTRNPDPRAIPRLERCRPAHELAVKDSLITLLDHRSRAPQRTAWLDLPLGQVRGESPSV